MADNKSRGLSIELDMDVSNAIKGLKAVQREAKEATKSLRELENVRQAAGVYLLAFPRTLWIDNQEFGTWDILKDDNGNYISFESVEKAERFAEAPYNDLKQRVGEFYVIKIHG